MLPSEAFLKVFVRNADILWSLIFYYEFAAIAAWPESLPTWQAGSHVGNVENIEA